MIKKEISFEEYHIRVDIVNELCDNLKQNKLTDDEKAFVVDLINTIDYNSELQRERLLAYYRLLPQYYNLNISNSAKILNISPTLLKQSAVLGKRALFYDSNDFIEKIKSLNITVAKRCQKSAKSGN